MPALTRAQIDALKPARALAPVKVPAEEWYGKGAYVLVRRWSGRDRQKWESDNDERIQAEDKLCRAEDRKFDWKRVAALTLARACVFSLVDEDGELLYPDATEAEVVAFADKPGDVQARVFKVVSRMSGLRPDDIEALVKNSVGAPDAVPSSGSASESGAGTPTSSPSV